MPFKHLSRFAKKKNLKPKEMQHLQQPSRNVKEIVLSVINNRREVREFKLTEVSDETIAKLIDAARHAHSEGNQQPWEFVIVRDPLVKELLAEAAFNQAWLRDAPVLIVACTNMRLAAAVHGERGDKLYGIQATAAAVQNMLIAAEALGLGSACVGEFSERGVILSLELAEYIRPAEIVAIGWPAERGIELPLQSAEEFTYDNKFGASRREAKILKEKKELSDLTA